MPARPCSGTPRQSAGFTAAGVRPWLPGGGSASGNVAVQRDDPGSVLRLCRDLLALRSAAFSGRIARYRRLPGPPAVWAYQVDELVVTANFSERPARLEHAPGQVLASCAGTDGLRGTTIAPWAGVITAHRQRRS